MTDELENLIKINALPKDTVENRINHKGREVVELIYKNSTTNRMRLIWVLSPITKMTIDGKLNPFIYVEYDELSDEVVKARETVMLAFDKHYNL